MARPWHGFSTRDSERHGLKTRATKKPGALSGNRRPFDAPDPSAVWHSDRAGSTDNDDDRRIAATSSRRQIEHAARRGDARRHGTRDDDRRPARRVHRAGRADPAEG